MGEQCSFNKSPAGTSLRGFFIAKISASVPVLKQSSAFGLRNSHGPEALIFLTAARKDLLSGSMGTRALFFREGVNSEAVVRL